MSTNKIKLSVSPCSIPRRYSINPVSNSTFSPYRYTLVLHLFISLLIASMIFVGIFASSILLINQVCDMLSNAFL